MHLLFHPDSDNDIPLALTTLEKSTALSEQVYGRDNPETAMSYTNLAAAYHIVQQDDKADALIHKAIPITEKTLGKESPDSAYELQILGQILQSQQNTRKPKTPTSTPSPSPVAPTASTNTAVASALHYLSSLYQDMGDDTKKAAIDKQITNPRPRHLMFGVPPSGGRRRRCGAMASTSSKIPNSRPPTSHPLFPRTWNP